MVAVRTTDQVREQVGQLAVDASPHTVDAMLSLFHAAGTAPVRTAFAARGLRAVARLLQLSDDRALADAAGAPSDYAALLQLLAQPEVISDLGQFDPRDPLLPARIAGLRAREELLRAEGGPLKADQIAQLLGISRQAVDHRRRKGKLLALTLGRRGYAYPAWQVVEGRTIQGLDTVLAELRDFDPWTQAAFMLNPNTWLDDETPLNELRRGHVDRVREAASVYGEHVAA
ncbi:MAG: hypothetical protein QOF73_979 [Thermomicrobiales bacterium]|nr:hypothetical protein [Thermomicrobiales bacterium]